ncbi:uncharacterized protein [Prorops nasuta]|uniref:uncharacterized protein n=1 Tax=Prorops nasuta TaxID=863751 RepID=UPI0034CD23EB
MELDGVQKRKRCANITNEERTLLIEYLKKHPQLLKGKFTSSYTLKDAISLWTEITGILNAVNGAKKDWKGWRKCWHDLQSRSKIKQSEIKQSMAATGGGKAIETLTPQEEQIIDVMCSTSIYGHPDIGESVVNIVEESENESMEVEYLQEYEEDVVSIANSDDAQNKPTSKKFLYGKENIIRKQNTNINANESSCISNELKNNGMTSNAIYCEQGKTEKKKNISKKALQNTLEVSTNLNNIYENTYELKKKYYEERLKYMKRSVEAKEKMAISVENCKIS